MRTIRVAGKEEYAASRVIPRGLITALMASSQSYYTS